MKKLKIFALSLMLLATVLISSSCSDLHPSDGNFIVSQLRGSHSSDYDYYLKSDGGYGSFWYKSNESYIVGDTLVLIRLRK